MSHSIEQGVHFHLARRFVKLIAPEFRALASPDLEQDACILDLTQRTIEVSESASELHAVGAILFQLGHLRLRERLELSEHFGRIPPGLTERQLLGRLAKQGAIADELAVDWALSVFSANWPVSEEDARAIVSRYAWDRKTWRRYYLP